MKSVKPNGQQPVIKIDGDVKIDFAQKDVIEHPQTHPDPKNSPQTAVIRLK